MLFPHHELSTAAMPQTMTFRSRKTQATRLSLAGATTILTEDQERFPSAISLRFPGKCRPLSYRYPLTFRQSVRYPAGSIPSVEVPKTGTCLSCGMANHEGSSSLRWPTLSRSSHQTWKRFVVTGRRAQPKIGARLQSHMDAKIKSQFWTDPVIWYLPMQLKLAALWAITSSQTSLFGYVEIDPRQFRFETGCPLNALRKLCDAHPRGFMRAGSGYWIRRYIAHQIGTGNKLSKSKMGQRAARHLCLYREHPVMNLVLEEYPELEKAVEQVLQRFNESSY